MLAPIQIRAHKFVELSLKPELNLSEDERKKRSVTCRHQLGWNRDDARKVWMARLRLELIHADDGTKSLYTGAFELVGEFEIHPDFPEKDELKLLVCSAGNMLYSATREWVTIMSARSLHGTIELPTIDARVFFAELVETLPKD